MEGHVMEKDHRVITRRDFLRTGALAAAGGVIGLPFARSAQGWSGKKSRVVLIRDRNVIDGSGTIQGTVLEKMMELAVKTLMEAPDLATAWGILWRPLMWWGSRAMCGTTCGPHGSWKP
jgi:hypothetical protein